MVGATRRGALKENIKRPVTPSDDGTIADAPIEGTTDVDQSNTYTPAQQPVVHPARDDVSRLSEGLEPLHLVGQDGKFRLQPGAEYSSLTTIQIHSIHTTLPQQQRLIRLLST